MMVCRCSMQALTVSNRALEVRLGPSCSLGAGVRGRAYRTRLRGYGVGDTPMGRGWIAPAIAMRVSAGGAFSLRAPH